MILKKRLLIAGAFCFGLSGLISDGFAQAKRVFTVQTTQPKAVIQPTMWGIFFEDINLGADGGLYAELVKNRSFEFDNALMGWKEQKKEGSDGSLVVNTSGSATKANRRYVRLDAKTGTGYGLSNEGFRGMGIKKDNGYDFSVMARMPEGSRVTLNVELVNPAGDVIGSASVAPHGAEWKKYSVSFHATATEPKAHLNIWLNGLGAVDLDMISLFPQDTWKQRPGGLRADMVQLLADMKPGFLRFPGGCIVEGRNIDERFQWKNTIGKVEDRDLIINRWNVEFKHRLTPDYYQTFGLGFFEYFQLCEDIGAQPLPILNCGMACQFNTGEVVPLDQLDPFVKDALDLIEFANGPVTSEWGKKRAQMGHPAPFNMKMLGVGNENWGPLYIERLKVFTKAIKEKYPEIKIVNSSGTDPNGERFDYLNKELRSMHADIIDEHYYRAPKWFLENASRYDNYDRKGPKIFAGEYAAQSDRIASPDNKNNWECALSEAAFMTGLERNADVVVMASYAPLFAHAEGWQWTPDLIWVDNLQSYGTANYQVQKLFSVNKGSVIVPMLLNGKAVSGQDGFYASASIDKKTNELILKIVNSSSKEQEGEILFAGVKSIRGKGVLTELSNKKLDHVNSFDEPLAISPVQRQIPVKDNKVILKMNPYSVNVVRVAI